MKASKFPDLYEFLDGSFWQDAHGEAGATWRTIVKDVWFPPQEIDAAIADIQKILKGDMTDEQIIEELHLFDLMSVNTKLEPHIKYIVTEDNLEIRPWLRELADIMSMRNRTK